MKWLVVLVMGLGAIPPPVTLYVGGHYFTSPATVHWRTQVTPSEDNMLACLAYFSADTGAESHSCYDPRDYGRTREGEWKGVPDGTYVATIDVETRWGTVYHAEQTFEVH